MAVQKQDDQHEHTFSSYVRIRDVVLKTCQGHWTIGRSGERGSGISVLPARHDDDDDMHTHTSVWVNAYVHVCVCVCICLPDCIYFKKLRPCSSSSFWQTVSQKLTLSKCYCASCCVLQLFGFGLVWFGFFVLWHINLHLLFNTTAILVEQQWWYYLTHSLGG